MKIDKGYRKMMIKMKKKIDKVNLIILKIIMIAVKFLKKIWNKLTVRNL